MPFVQVNLGQLFLSTVLFPYAGWKPLGISWTGFYVPDLFPSCQSTISVKALKRTQSTNPNQWHGFIISSSVVRLLMEEALCCLYASCPVPVAQSSLANMLIIFVICVITLLTFSALNEHRAWMWLQSQHLGLEATSRCSSASPYLASGLVLASNKLADSSVLWVRASALVLAWKSLYTSLTVMY